MLNNAGYSLVGTSEEASAVAIRALYELIGVLLSYGFPTPILPQTIALLVGLVLLLIVHEYTATFV